MPVFTLAQLQFGWFTTYAVCGRCGHFSAIDLDKLIARSPGKGDCPVETAAARLLCNTCGARQAKLTSTRPTVGERVCPKCGQALWRRRSGPATGGRACSRCLRPMGGSRPGG